MNWDEYEKATGQKRPPWIDGVGNVNYQWNAAKPQRKNSQGELRALQNMPQVAPAGMRGGLMPPAPQPQVNSWQPTAPGLAWVQAGAALRPRGF